MAAGDHARLIEDCMRLGDASRGGDPHLWSEVLEYFARQPQDCTEQVLTMANAQHGHCLLVHQTLSYACDASPYFSMSSCIEMHRAGTENGQCTALPHACWRTSQSGILQSLGPASPFD